MLWMPSFSLSAERAGASLKNRNRVCGDCLKNHLPGANGFAFVTATIVVVILYGSLYPFGFSNNPHGEGPIRSLWETRSFFPSAGNLIANFILYVPVGFFWVQASRQRRFSSVVIALFAGISLSTFIEVMQFYDAGRYSNMSDIYVNGAGTLFGAVAASLVRKIRDFCAPMDSPIRCCDPSVALLAGLSAVPLRSRDQSP